MKEFPHCCAFCQKYYPRNDRNNVMKGGGECWTWGGVRGGDSSVNSCQRFVALEERSIVQKAMYVVKAVCLEDGYRVAFMDSFLHVGFLSSECGSIRDGVSMVGRGISEIAEYLKRCVASMSCGKLERKSARFSKGENETINNPQSDTRRRFNTVLRGFPKNIQLGYKFISEGNMRGLKLRIYHADGNPSIEVSDDYSGGFVGISDYCGRSATNHELVSILLDEFKDFHKFVNSLKKEMEK